MSANLLANSNFSRGAVGFATGYSKGGNSLIDAGTYAVGTNPHQYHFAGASFGDHTTGTGKMLMVNGSPTAGTVVWRESVSVAHGVAYDFNGWATSWATGGPEDGDVSPADIQITIDGKVISSTILTSTPGQWSSLTGDWLATSSRANIVITDLNTDVAGNDSAYDDFSFSALASIHGTVASAAVNANGKVSARHKSLAGVTLFIDANGNGTLDPGEITAVSSKSGTFTFTGLAAGTYEVCQANAPSYDLPPAELTITLAASKQLSHEKLLDIYTAVVPTVGVFN